MTLTTECKQGHTCFTWNCEDCKIKLAHTIWEINRWGDVKAK